jgi:hypothetical protein
MTLSYDYHRIDHDDGERLDETVESKRDFWFAEALPFSPLQMVPLRVINDYRYLCYCSPAGGRINDVVDARLEDELRDAGMLLRTRRYSDGEPGDVVEISGLRSAAGMQLDPYRQLPVIPASRETPAVGALLLQEMLADAPAEGAGTADVSFGASPGGPAPAFSGVSWFRVNPAGDFAIANVLTTDSGAEGLLLLMRPYHGLPQAGSYSTRAQPERKELESLELEALKERARYFQVVGLVEDGEELTIYTGTGEGEIMITNSAEERIEGEFSLAMDAIDTFGSGEVECAVVTGQFGANDGLKARMRSVLGRLIERQE